MSRLQIPTKVKAPGKIPSESGSLHVLVGENRAAALLRRRAAKKLTVNWIVPKSAKVGDLVALFIPAKGFVGLASVVTEPDSTTFGRKPAWGAEVGGIRVFRRAISPGLVAHQFPSWRWASYPRSLTTVSGGLAMQLSEFLSRTHDEQQPDPDPAQEGAAREAKTTARARNGRLRHEALERARGICTVCETDYSKWLDGRGVRVLQVHHLRQLSLAKAPRLTRVADLAVVCANCHALLHLDPKKTLGVTKLRKMLSRLS